MCIFVTICFLLFFWLIPISLYADNEIHLTLIPPAIVTNQVDLDIRGGVVNKSSQEQMYIVSLYWNKEDDEHLICRSTFKLLPGQSKTVCSIVDTEKRIGQNRVIFKVKSQNKLYRKVKDIEICKSDIRSTQRLSGAWTGIYHWSETEGKYWNKKLQEMTDSHWGEMVRVTFSHASQPSSTVAKCPAPTAASIAAPAAGPSSTFIVTTWDLYISACIWSHSSLFAPPPFARISVTE